MGVEKVDATAYQRYLEVMAEHGPFEHTPHVHDDGIEDHFELIQASRFASVAYQEDDVNELEDIHRYDDDCIHLDYTTYFVQHGDLYLDVLDVDVTEDTLTVTFDTDFDLPAHPHMYTALGKIHELASKHAGHHLQLKVMFE